MEGSPNTWLAVAGIAGTIIGASIGSIVTGWYTRANNRDQMKHAEDMAASQRQHAERMATLEKRLEAHQEAYSKAYDLVVSTLISVRSPETVEEKNLAADNTEFLSNLLAYKRLYLSSTVVEELHILADTMQDVVNGNKTERDAINQMKQLSDTILEAISLPVIEQEGIFRHARSHPLPPPG